MDTENQRSYKVARGDTVIRILLTVLFAVVGNVLNPILGVIVIFSLAYALITQEPPSRRVRQFANRVIAYSYRIRRYVTYNESTVPFPFSEFPAGLEPVGSPHEETDSDLRELLRNEPEDDDTLR